MTEPYREGAEQWCPGCVAKRTGRARYAQLSSPLIGAIRWLRVRAFECSIATMVIVIIGSLIAHGSSVHAGWRANDVKTIIWKESSTTPFVACTNVFDDNWSCISHDGNGMRRFMCEGSSCREKVSQ